MKKIAIVILFITLHNILDNNILAQSILSNSEQKRYKEALEFAKGTNNNTAIKILTELYNNHPNDIDISYNLGICYMNMSGNPDSALFYLNHVLDLDKDEWTDSRCELYMAIARTHQLKYEYDKAIEIYNLVEHHDAERNWIDLIARERDICKSAKDLIETPVKLEIKTIENINSEYDDYRPVISRDNKTLIFTSRKGNGTSFFQDGQYEESCYQSKFDDNSWSKPEQIKGLFDEPNEQETATCIANNDTELYLCKDGLIYCSKKDTTTGKWLKAVELGEPINRTDSECRYACVSEDGSEMFFSSNRAGGYGGFDIYHSYRLPNGKWGIPRNLGDNINSSYDEDAPILNNEESILYFSSNGHNTMGGFDIFYAIEKPDSTFEVIHNIGYPINTPDDDIYFVPTAEKDMAYYASMKWNNQSTGFDIYQVIYDEPEAQKLVIISGYIKANDLYDVTIHAEANGEQIGRFAPNRETGKFIVIAEAGGTYTITANDKERNIVQIISTKPCESYLKSGRLVQTADFDFLKTDNEDFGKGYETANNGNTEVVQDANKRIANDIPSDGRKHYTVQIMSLRRPCSAEDTKLEANQIHEFKYRDGWYVYTYGIFDNKSDARKAERKIKALGLYDDAFVRNIDQYKRFTE